MGMNGGINNVPAGRDYSSLPREEPEKIKKWREEQKIRLEAKGLNNCKSNYWQLVITLHFLFQIKKRRKRRPK